MLHACHELIRAPLFPLCLNGTVFILLQRNFRTLWCLVLPDFLLNTQSHFFALVKVIGLIFIRPDPGSFIGLTK